jgi:hypothetical protein
MSPFPVQPSFHSNCNDQCPRPSALPRNTQDRHRASGANTFHNDARNSLGPCTPNPCPTSKRFDYDPKDVWPQNGLPALYIHWKSGRSQQWSLLKGRAVDTYELVWIGPSRNEPTGATATSGTVAVIQRALRQAEDRGSHPDYSYDGAPLGEPPHITVGFQGWELVETQAGAYKVTPSTKGARVDYYPVLKATIRTYSIVEQPTPQDPGDALGDSTLGIYTTGLGDVNDVMPFAEMILPAPDGSEDGDE